MRGRTPSGPESVEQLPGSDKAKERVRVILQTMTGELRVQEACAQLDVCEQHIRQLRTTLLLAAIDSVEDKPPGRPAQAEEPSEVTALRAQVAELQRQLQAARLSAEIAMALPHVGVASPQPALGPTAPQKKRRRRKRR
jgi:transposase-like protein